MRTLVLILIASMMSLMMPAFSEAGPKLKKHREAHKTEHAHKARMRKAQHEARRAQ
jgi:hypothetical protein